MKKIVVGCSIAFVLTVGIVITSFYLVFRTKKRDVSNEAPFEEITKQKITTKVKTQILKYPTPTVYEDYNYHLEDGTGFGMNSELKIIAEIPVGTSITVEKVELHTGRVSGTTSAYLFGSVFIVDKQEEYFFQYSWGDYRSLYQDRPYWVFEKGFWQEEALEEKYFIEVP
ncbi:hypothetical protein ACFSQJ_19490 [Croceitalea marina]|uniref:DUF4178 domain-containing protein n=1 Tax=Croceitalea marina TaxID=1775166 RepID=A0ABW5N0E1_9FLAO